MSDAPNDTTPQIDAFAEALRRTKLPVLWTNPNDIPSPIITSRDLDPLDPDVLGIDMDGNEVRRS